MLKNIVGFALEEEYRSVELPRYAVVGISTLISGYTLAIDSEYIFGHYGGLEKKTVDIWFLRAGLEKAFGQRYQIRAGLIYPAVAKSSSAGDMTDNIPSPKIGGSIGIGAAFKWGYLDFAIYGDPAKSYVEQQPRLRSELSITFELN